MPAHVVIGTQWGDEGKGRVVDLLAMNSDFVARYAGGDNAGHTIRIGEETFKLHLVPSGVLHPGKRCAIGGGVVVNPLALASELQGLAERGLDISPNRVALAETAHIITPAHIALDKANEAQRGDSAIGTTCRGIGPAYTDKAARTGLRAGSMRNPDTFVDQVRRHIEYNNRLLADVYKTSPLDIDTAISGMHAAAEFLAPYLADVPLLLHQALQAGKIVLCEGAQGTLLDIDHGIYPYVTSSSATVGGAITGLGIGPHYIDRVIGVTKAYSTRVGGGPFPTELRDALGDKLRGTGDNPWDEYGTTTGRPRRCGWLDTLVVRYAARINGLTELVVTKLDVLSGFDTLQVANSYTIDGAPVDTLLCDLETHQACRPVYHNLPGWSEDIMHVRSFTNLPSTAQGYIDYLEELTGLPVKTITIGPARDQTIEH
ncbi:MAG: adenylosuccinate synthase [Anaerolineae bacterium]|nr:adenylosuccinate synthase [Anaerolineae bacterium]